MKNIHTLFLAIVFVFQSCGKKTEEKIIEVQPTPKAVAKNSIEVRNEEVTSIFNRKKFNKMVYDNEEVIYTFETNSNKEIVIVKDTTNSYIKYRYGNNGKIEMEYPKESTKESWKKFQYNSYWRGGGKENSGQEIDNLQFTNNGYTYLIYRTYFAEDESFSAGIIITDIKNKEIRINGNPKTIEGCICNLEETGLIEKTDIGLSF